MERTIYALLVGIDDYPNPRDGHHGWINDVMRMRESREARFDGEAGFKLAAPVAQLDSRSTRQVVVDASEGHLGRAGKGEVALFDFSGHRSRQGSPEDFWHVEWSNPLSRSGSRRAVGLAEVAMAT